LNAAGAERVELSMAIATFCIVSAGRLLEPEKDHIVASPPSAHGLVRRFAMTNAEPRPDIDFPQPFGTLHHARSSLVQSGNPSVRRTT
jgi:hypothetical protein